MKWSILLRYKYMMLLLGCIFLLPSCHLFQQGRYKVINGMEFQTFSLGNQLEVLAISDDRFVKSSAALAVMAGSMQNPDEHLGLAHFLEHMLFLGTKEYPEVGEYENYLNKNGGGHNAYTSIDHTNYFFDIDHKAFKGALERFSRFFVSPTFDPKYLDREKNAVHSEHEKNLKDDGRREHRFQQVITDPKHPFSKFATGDKDTLSKANREVVMGFYKENYSSNLMKLVLMSDLPPAELKKLAEKHFSEVNNNKKEKPTFSDKLFLEKEPKLNWVETVRDRDALKVSFDIPDDMSYWESKPTIFLAHLLGDEGEGSLLSYLKEKGWALGLSTSTWWRMFSVRITMTEKGKENYQEVVKAVFSYIKLLKKEGLKKYLFDERKSLAEADLNNLEPKSSMSRASDYSASMLYYPADKFLKQHYLYHKYSPEDFDKFLSYLRVDNMQTTILSKSTEVKEKEKYYGIGYKRDNIDSGFVKILEDIEIYPEFKYPVPNNYIPTSLDLVEKPKTFSPESEVYGKGAQFYVQTDTDLKIPKGSISLSFISDKIKADPKKYLLAKVFSIVKKEELNEWGYPARLAGLHYSVSHGHNTITLDVSGYSQHLGQLLQNLIFDKEQNRRIDKVSIDEDYFKKIKNKLKKNLLNHAHDAAYQQLLYEVGNMVSTGSVHRNDYVSFIDGITLKDLNDFAEEFFKKVAIRGYGYGNLKMNSLKIAVDSYVKNISSEAFTDEEVSKFENKYTKIPDKKLLIPMKGVNNNNAFLTLYRFNDWTIADQAKVEIITRMLEQPFFTELRTHQQLGYIVAAFPSTSSGFAGIGTLIQSQNFEPKDIYGRATKFMSEVFKKYSENLSDKEIEPVKSALINEISKQPNSLGERLSRFTSMAATYHGDFEFYNKFKTQVEKVDANLLKTFIKEKITENKTPSQLTFLYYGADSKDKSVPQGLDKVDSTKKFRDQAEKFQPYRKSKDM